ncbi:MAG: UTP--glucose-1-phosphate uridylyltransferase [Calditrichaceae bacterium]
MSGLKNELNDFLTKYGQQHILKYWDQLDLSQKDSLLSQIRSIDFEHLDELYQMAQSQSFEKKRVIPEPADIVTLSVRKKRDAGMAEIGENALKNGKVAAFLVAGGQGSRLGFNGPKGIFPISPVKKKSLFQVHSEKLLATGKKYGVEIPWYIMTSKTNDEATRAFFNKNGNFGYSSENIMFFKQGMMPALNKQGKLILDSVSHIFMSPNGHGGSIKALWDSGAIDDMQKRSLEYIYYFQIDNVLTNICDPLFLGYHIENHSEMSNKVVRKAYPEEKMGVICAMDGKMGVLEYSDMEEEEMYAVNPDGRLKFWAGSIAAHIINVNFIERENSEGFRLPFHIAEKSIPFLDNNTRRVMPEEKNGYKFETFVFDALADSKNPVTIEVERDKEFSALKNKDGKDSPDSVRDDMLRIYRTWLEHAGVKVPENITNIEISPFFALNEQDLIEKKNDVPAITENIYIE